MPINFLKSRSLASKAGRLFIKARELSSSVQLGTQPQNKKGSGQEFYDFRPYSPDIHEGKIDWRQSAKRDELLVRQKEHELNNQFLLFTDFSPSMNLSCDKRKTKRTLADLFALALCFVFQKTGDNFTFYGSGLRFSRTENHIMACAEFLSAQKPVPSDTVKNAIPIILTDFWAPLKEIETMVNTLPRYKHGIAVQIVEAQEIDFRFKGNILFEAAKGQKTHLIEKCEDVADAYQKKIAKHLNDVEHLLARRNLRLVRIRNDEPADRGFLRIVDALHAFGETGR